MTKETQTTHGNILLDNQIDYSIQLQQIIEAICKGHEIPHQHLHHGKMATKFMEEQNITEPQTTKRYEAYK